MKDISDQEVIAHLKRLNGWWPDGNLDGDVFGLTSRAYLPAVKELLTDEKLRRAVVLMGPRRVGKTVLILHLIRDLVANGVNPKQIAYVEMDHPLLRGRSMESLIDLMAGANGDTAAALRYVFFDEIQYLKDWEQHLKQLVDHRRDLRILVSGSAAAALKRRSQESGAGRFTDFLLPPLTFKEYMELAETDPAMNQVDSSRFTIRDFDRLNEQFVDYVNFGGYPELALSKTIRSDPGRFIKSDIVDKVLLRDLPQLYGIQDIQELNALFTLLAYNTGNTVSPQDLSKRCGVGKATIQRYIEYLEAAFLLKRIYRIDQDGSRYQRDRNFKIYLTNPAMRTGLFGPSERNSDGFGHLVETAIYAQRFHEDANLHYARWGKEDCEVDMIECDAQQKPIMALEVKWSDNLTSVLSGSSALQKFCRHNKLAVGNVSSLSHLFERHDLDVPIRVWPSAAVAYVYGAQAVAGKLAKFTAQIELER